METFFASIENVCDTASIAFYCESDQTMLLTIVNMQSFYLPTIKLQTGNSTMSQLKDTILKTFLPANTQLTISEMLRQYKLWNFFRAAPVYHTIFLMLVTSDMKKKISSAMGKYKGKIYWANEKDLKTFQSMNNLASPEMLDYYYLCNKNNMSHKLVNVPQEFVCTANIFEIPDTVIPLPKDTIFQQLITAAGFAHQTQETLYNEFLVMASPAHFMNMQVFGDFLLRSGWQASETLQLFRSADISSRGGLSYREFLFFLAVVEPGITFKDGPAELRFRYIFKYLDSENRNILKSNQLKRYCHLALMAAPSMPDSHQQHSSSTETDMMKHFKELQVSENGLTMSDFLKLCTSNAFMGLSHIYRAPKSLHKILKAKSTRGSKRLSNSSYRSLNLKSVLVVKLNYEIGHHVVRIGHGLTIRTEEIQDLRKPSQASLTINRSDSIFDQDCTENELLRMVRYLVNMNKKENCYMKIEELNYIWGKENFIKVATHIINVSDAVRKVFVQEPRLLEISAPVYVFGDLHGNIEDLLHFERIFWPMGPGICPSKMLFLGDLVDRGVFSFEVISYLFCHKLLNPGKLFMVRGNHEIRQIQQLFTFEKECKLKFGEKMGRQVFDSVNQAFDSMPLAAVIDRRIFCCHGGIPPPWTCPSLSAINDIAVVLDKPMDQSPLAWELMWNDPMRNGPEGVMKLTMECMANEGFAANVKRGTGHMFTVSALDRFLSTNKLSHVIRGHEMIETGFTLLHNSKLISVFSSSRYCGWNNVAACALVSQEKIRMFTLDLNLSI